MRWQAYFNGPVLAVLAVRSVAAYAIFVLFLLAGHHIGTRQPAIEVDVAAALGAERPERIRDRLGAERTARGRAGVSLVRHRVDMGIVGRILKPR